MREARGVAPTASESFAVYQVPACGKLFVSLRGRDLAGRRFDRAWTGHGAREARVSPEDVGRIAEALGVALPESYRRAVVPYPVRAGAGNRDLGIWDDADFVIARNAALRRGAGGQPWPAHMLAIGDTGDGCLNALDLRAGDAVWWVDHGHLDAEGTYVAAEALAPWAAEYFASLRADWAGDLIDPDGTPAERARAESKHAKDSAVGCVVAAMAVAAVAGLVKLIADR